MSEADRDLFDVLMTLQGVKDLSNKELLANIGSLIDFSDDLQREDGTARALEWCEILERRNPLTQDFLLLEYFRANAWGNRQRYSHRDTDAAWSWEQPELQKQVFHLRRVVNHPGFDEFHSLRRCQVLTNLGNQMNTVGRFVEAMEYWDRALSINRQFGMALGNRGYGLERYARALYDDGHKALFARFAHDTLNAALSTKAYYESPAYEGAKAVFVEVRARLAPVANAASGIDVNNHNIGASEEERQYRHWCLQTRLFLNPLNDLGAHSIASNDVLTLPDFVTGIHEPPTLIGFFNQMKQEFVSARWLYYEGVHAKDPHFSDRGVLLFNTLDYPSYGLAIEKIKAAFRIAYSLFDKIGFFLNDYMQLGVKEKDVYFKNIWYRNYEKRELRPELEQSENWPFRGLHWLAKDLVEKEFEDVMEPDAEALYKIRNHLEHKYLKVHEMLIPRTPDTMLSSLWTDRLAYSVQRQVFEAKTLRLLRLARAALIYSSLGMHREEIRRQKHRGKTVNAPMTLEIWDDERKR